MNYFCVNLLLNLSVVVIFLGLQVLQGIFFLCSKFSDNVEKGKPFPVACMLRTKEPLELGSKLKDFEGWKKVAKLMANKSHLTSEGLDRIRKIKAGCRHASQQPNKGRID